MESEAVSRSERRELSGRFMKSGTEVLTELLEGNRRFSGYAPDYPNQSDERRRDAVRGQHPVAVVLGCSDSRVPPELIFDQGIGDLFVLRTAGHVVDDAVLGSMEYAVAHLKVPLVMVLGHSDCGAVKAALAGGEDSEGRIASVTRAIRPALSGMDKKAPDAVDQAARIHAGLVARELRSAAPILSDAADAGTLKVVSGFYSLDTGLVEVLS